MKKAVVAGLMTVLAVMSLVWVSSAYPTPASPTIITPDKLTWTPAKDIKGLQYANLSGDMNHPGPFTVRLKFADGTKIPLHRHPTDERFTVLSGTLMFTTRDAVHGTQTTALPPGSFVFVPAGAIHGAAANGETITQTTGTGPFTRIWVK